MALFDVPGWSIPTPAPVREESHSVSKKRKRPANDANKMKAVEVNLEKIMATLNETLPDPRKEEARSSASNSKQPTQGQPKSKKRKQRHDTAPIEAEEHGKKSSPSPAQKTKLEVNPGNSTNNKSKEYRQPNDAPARKKEKRKEKAKSNASTAADAPVAKAKPATVKSKTAAGASLTSLQQSMKEKLDGARFRLINENLYKSDSHSAHQMMREDPQVFEEYHTGFRHQVLSWPINPVEHYISYFASYPSKTVIADLGCGDAALARGLLPKGISVISFDLVSDKKYVVEADICDKVPLPGSEEISGEQKSTGEGQVVDVVVCALSLMGVNWVNCIREAWRILKAGGELHIAEVTSRFTDIEQFQSLLGTLGFRMKSKDEATSSHFVLLEFVKVARTSKTEKEWSHTKDIDGRSANSRESELLFIMPSSKVHIVSHPIVNGELSKLRKASTSPKEFREGVDTISLLLGYEASRNLDEVSFVDQTPVAQFTGTKVGPRIGLTPILRAGLGMTDALLKLFPSAPVYHLGLYREKVTLQPVEYYSKLPASPPIDQVFLLDPLIATGGTACAALGMIVEWGIPVQKIKLLSILASEAGLQHIQEEYPNLEIWVAGVDKELTAEGIINPGLGDTGDRLFNTIRP
ncbi:uracil phosphoribosyltransferase [Agrocybe pediades]|nr:uracil phosphoribosyltransferase [Agrocybe pediades]